MATEKLTSELMNEEQLDAVVGGSRGELSCDTKLLYALGLMNHYYEPAYIENHAREVASEVSATLKRTLHLNVLVYYSSNGTNKYLMTGYYPSGQRGRLTTRPFMYQIICNSAGKPGFDFTKYI